MHRISSEYDNKIFGITKNRMLEVDIFFICNTLWIKGPFALSD